MIKATMPTSFRESKVSKNKIYTQGRAAFSTQRQRDLKTVKKNYLKNTNMAENMANFLVAMVWQHRWAFALSVSPINRSCCCSLALWFPF